MRIRTGHAPDAWSENIPSACHSPIGRHDPRPAERVGNMRPIIVGSVLSMTVTHAVDDAHAIADSRLRRAYSIRPENRR